MSPPYFELISTFPYFRRTSFPKKLFSYLWDNWYPMCFIWDIQCRINGGKSNLNWNVEKFQNIMSRILGKQFRCCFFYFSSWTCDKTDVSANKVTKWIVNCNGRRYAVISQKLNRPLYPLAFLDYYYLTLGVFLSILQARTIQSMIL